MILALENRLDIGLSFWSLTCTLNTELLRKYRERISYGKETIGTKDMSNSDDSPLKSEQSCPVSGTKHLKLTSSETVYLF